MSAEFTPQTLEYVARTDLAYRKRLGQYFTPRSVREALLRRLPEDRPGLRILDPACGTGEFLVSAAEHFPDADIEGWDIDPALIEIAKGVSPASKLSVLDALTVTHRAEYDLVIGNPPYFEFSPDSGVKKRYGMLMSGRTNVFGLFMKLGLDLLREGGHLAYVVPPSMNNGAYFARVREYIVAQSNIEFLEILEDASLFQDALQMTMLLILRKGGNRGSHVFRHDGILIFSEDVGYLEASFRGAASLRELGFSVRTGRLVWNQNKERLTDDAQEGIPLMWAHNISDAGLRFPVVRKKPQYVRAASHDVGPAIVVNRITGAAKAARIRAALVPPGMRFVAENHCNVIFPPAKGRRPKPGKGGTVSLKGNISLEDLCAQLRSPEKLEVMRRITGNTQISKTELERLFPISL